MQKLSKLELKRFKELYKLANLKREKSQPSHEILVFAEPTDSFMEPLIFHITKNK